MILELFKFTNDTPSIFNSGEVVEGYDSISWIERYREAGEFEITGKLSSGLLDKLPRGSYISHQGTWEVMAVEDHYINEKSGEDPIIKITGPSVEKPVLENRVVGANANWLPGYRVIEELTIPSGYLSSQIANLINDHIETGVTLNVYDRINDMLAITTVVQGDEQVARPLKRGLLYKAVQELLGVEDLGIRVHRRSSMTGAHPDAGNTLFIIHEGNDVSENVIFSSDGGMIDNAEYFWSSKLFKTSALVVGQHLEVLVEATGTPIPGISRRVMYVDAEGLDDSYEPGMAQALIDEIVDKMETLGRQTLKNQRQVGLISVDISKSKSYRYRQDYQMGDIVSVLGVHGSEEKMRVIEHVEIEEENNAVSYPTLSKL